MITQGSGLRARCSAYSVSFPPSNAFFHLHAYVIVSFADSFANYFLVDSDFLKINLLQKKVYRPKRGHNTTYLRRIGHL